MASPAMAPAGPTAHRAMGAQMSTMSMGLRKVLVMAGVMRSTSFSTLDSTQAMMMAGKME